MYVARGPQRTPTTILSPAHFLVREALARDKDMEGSLLAATPAGRIGEPDEIAGCVSWLTSEDAGFVTGASILRFDIVQSL